MKIGCWLNSKETKTMIGLKLPEELKVVIHLNVLKDGSVSKDSSSEELGVKKKTLNCLN